MNTKKLKTSTEPAILAFLETAASLERRLDHALAFRGITFSEYRLLRALSENSTGFPRIALANKIGLTPSAVTRALKPLEKLGYITTSRNERDARQSLAVITKAGTQLLGEARLRMQEVLITLPFNAQSQQEIEAFESQLMDLQ